MLTYEEIACAGNYVEELRVSVHNLEVPSDPRTRAAGSCFAIALEHHHAIVRLIKWKLFAAAFALWRIEFEVYIRGEWLYQRQNIGTQNIGHPYFDNPKPLL